MSAAVGWGAFAIAVFSPSRPIMLAAGTIQVPVHATHPMAEAPAAYERFAAGGKLGKIVLVRGPQ